MKNDYGTGAEKISVPPTLLFTALGFIEDISLAVTMDFKRPGDLVYVVGESFPECGCSEYFAMLGAVGEGVPGVDAARSRAVFQALHQAMKARLVASCHDASDGGLGVALAECAFAGNLGAEISLAKVPGAENFQRDDLLMFSESQGRFVVSVHPENRGAFESLLAPVACSAVGQVTENKAFRVRSIRPGGPEVIGLPLDRLKKAWKSPLDW